MQTPPRVRGLIPFCCAKVFSNSNLLLETNHLAQGNTKGQLVSPIKLSLVFYRGSNFRKSGSGAEIS